MTVCFTVAFFIWYYQKFFHFKIILRQINIFSNSPTVRLCYVIFLDKKDIGKTYFLTSNARNQWKLSFGDTLDVKVSYQIIFCQFY